MKEKGGRRMEKGRKARHGGGREGEGGRFTFFFNPLPSGHDHKPSRDAY
jgi:hypothetical protein